MTNSNAFKIADFWDKKTVDKNTRINWWNCPEIIKHINKKVCGIEYPNLSDGLNDLIIKNFSDKIPFKSGVSIGAGSCEKEIRLIEKGIVSNFICYEYSRERIKIAKKKIQEKRLDNKIIILNENVFEKKTQKFDLVHWNNSLHHMLNTEEAIKWSKKNLNNGGIFYMDDYIGPSRFQWTESMIRISDSIRNLLSKYIDIPEKELKTLKYNLEFLIKSDPSEAADSDNIIPSIKKHFKNAEIIFTGGVIYHLALMYILNMFYNQNSKLVLDLLLLLDDIFSDRGENHYAVCYAVK